MTFKIFVTIPTEAGSGTPSSFIKFHERLENMKILAMFDTIIRERQQEWEQLTGADAFDAFEEWAYNKLWQELEWNAIQENIFRKLVRGRRIN